MVRQQGFFIIIICSVISCTCISSVAEPEALFSESAASDFVKQASEVYGQDPLDPKRIEEAITFLEAAYSLDKKSKNIPEQMLRAGAGTCYTGRDYSSNMIWAISRYMGPQANLEVAFGALKCVLENLNSRVDREAFLDQLIRNYSKSNPAFVSELTTQLGLLVAEKSDIQSALNYLAMAYQLNPYNQLAYSKLQELLSSQGDSIIPHVEILNTRHILSMNPYDLDVAIQYGDQMQRLQLYGIAAQAYEYAAQLYHYLYPDRPLPDEILHPWLLSCYNGDRLETKCLKIAEKYRDPKWFDLFLESVVGKTQIRLGQVEKGTRTLETAAKNAEDLLSAGQSSTVYPEYLAWFNSFITAQPDKALAWSNQAYQDDPNRPGTKTIFAYCLAANGQNDLAKQHAESLKDSDQIASLTMSIIQLSSDQKEEALESLKATIEMAPETFVAERAIEILNDQDSDYIPSVSPESMRETIEQEYRFGSVPAFEEPSKRFTAKLLFNGSDFLYGSDFSARLVIENTTSEPLVVSDEGLLSGHLRIDAVLEGDLNVKIENLLVTKFRPSQPILPSSHYSLPLDLNRGRLRKLLLTYPQADIRIVFRVYLDPTEQPSEQENSVGDEKSFQTQIHRRGIVLSRDFLMQRLDVLSKGQPGQKYQAAKLFVGLLAEQKAFELSRADYDHVQVERVLLVDSIRKLLGDMDWKIRLHTINSLIFSSTPLDPKVISEVSDNLNHEKWPVRLAAMYLLAKTQPDSFQKVLDWTAQHEAYMLNRKMAVALGGKEPELVSEENELEFQE